MLGIKDNVEDIASAFKKMAVLNPQRNRPTAESVHSAVGAAPEPVPRRHIDSEKAAELAAILEKTRKSKRTKKGPMDENQLSLFDFVA